LQFIIKWQSAAHFAINLKVAEGLTGFLEALIVRNNDDCSVEWSINVASDLRLAVKFVTCFLHNNHSDLVRGGFLLWQVVQVKIILSFCITHLHFLFFVF
jgi:hypothetical protein